MVFGIFVWLGDLKSLANLSKSLYVLFLLFFYAMTITIKHIQTMWLTEKKMLGLSRSQDMVTGEDKYREAIILDSTAVSAMNGASIIALSPPYFLLPGMTSQNSHPYSIHGIHNISHGVYVYGTYVLTTHVRSVPHQLPAL